MGIEKRTEAAIGLVLSCAVIFCSVGVVMVVVFWLLGIFETEYLEMFPD
jgi:hypothetical protein